MGNFYANVMLSGPLVEDVAEYLERLGRSAYLTGAGDQVTAVYDEEIDEQDLEVISKLTALLSRKYACPALAMVNQDDHVLYYLLFEAGEQIDEYVSCPESFDGDGDGEQPRGGDARKLCAAFDAPESEPRVESILRAGSFDKSGYVFAVDRHLDLASALGIPTYLAPCGFNDVEHGDVEPELMDEGLTRVGAEEDFD